MYDEECEVILEPATEQQCTQVDQVISPCYLHTISLLSPCINNHDVQVEYSEQCSTVYEQECVTVQEKVCREPDLEIVQLPPTDGYGVPQVRICYW